MDGVPLKPETILDFGDPNKELVFYPLQPCRVLDTRVASRYGFNPIPTDGTINVDVSGNEFAQGVPNVANCGVSIDAKAVVINLAAVPASGQGFVTVWPFNSPRPNAGQLNYSSFINQAAISNSFIVQICRGCTDEISIFTRPGSTHVVVDVLGYFSRPEKTPLQIYRAYLRKWIAGGWGTCIAWCPSGYSLTGGGCNTMSNVMPVQISYPLYEDEVGWRCGATNETMTSYWIDCHAICARIPGR
jgi:hypothetical protein